METHKCESSDCFQCKIKTISFAGYKESKGATRDNYKRTERECNEYARLRSEGQQPDGTSRDDLDKSKTWSDKLGVAYNGTDTTATLEKAKEEDVVRLLRTEGLSAKMKAM